MIYGRQNSITSPLSPLKWGHSELPPFKWTGTHKGEFLGVAPTGKKITRRTADVIRMKGDQIVGHWGVVDQVEMLKELGILKTIK